MKDSLEYQILLMIDAEAHCCYVGEKKTVLCP